MLLFNTQNVIINGFYAAIIDNFFVNSMWL